MERGGSARSTLRGMIDGYRASQIVCVASELGLADLVKAGASSYVELAARTGANPAALRRLLRALCGLGIFDHVAPDGVALNQLSELLLRDAKGSLDPWARTVLDQFYAGWGALHQSVMNGRTGFETVRGADAWTHRARNPKSGRLFNDAMASLAPELAQAVLEVCDFSVFRDVVDVGGGDGRFAAELLRAHPLLRATVQDRSAPDAPPADLHDRMSLVRDDFLVRVPGGADCYVLSRVLHDWDDETALRILRNVAAAMSTASALVLVERVLPPESASVEAALSDINMMVMNGGRERTLEEFRALLSAAGLELARALPTASILSLILSSRR